MIILTSLPGTIPSLQQAIHIHITTVATILNGLTIYQKDSSVVSDRIVPDSPIIKLLFITKIPGQRVFRRIGNEAYNCHLPGKPNKPPQKSEQTTGKIYHQISWSVP